ncbi:hypothetical protein [Sulfitobacter sp. 915]|uniref:hypothetical protein n=1 Tax=Sulfitobacter sp. 915 TaxID=3368558 RepID=UPI00374512D7
MKRTFGCFCSTDPYVPDIASARKSAKRVAFFAQRTICGIGETRQVLTALKETRAQQFLQHACH